VCVRACVGVCVRVCGRARIREGYREREEGEWGQPANAARPEPSTQAKELMTLLLMADLLMHHSLPYNRLQEDMYIYQIPIK
jgi:hypothetical protein